MQHPLHLTHHVSYPLNVNDPSDGLQNENGANESDYCGCRCVICATCNLIPKFNRDYYAVCSFQWNVLKCAKHVLLNDFRQLNYSFVTLTHHTFNEHIIIMPCFLLYQNSANLTHTVRQSITHHSQPHCPRTRACHTHACARAHTHTKKKPLQKLPFLTVTSKMGALQSFMGIWILLVTTCLFFLYKFCLSACFWCDSPTVGQSLLIHEVYRSETTTHHSR